MAGRIKHDPTVMRIIKSEGFSSYDEWAKKALWRLFGQAINEKDSKIHQTILRFAEEELKNRYLQAALSKSGDSSQPGAEQ